MSFSEKPYLQFQPGTRLVLRETNEAGMVCRVVYLPDHIPSSEQATHWLFASDNGVVKWFKTPSDLSDYLAARGAVVLFSPRPVPGNLL